MRGGTLGVRRGIERRCCIGKRRGLRSPPGRGAGLCVDGRGRAAGAPPVARAGSVCLRVPRRGHVRAAARCRRPPPLTGDAAGVPRRSAAAQQGNALPRGSADDPGDRDRDAPRGRRCPRPPAARADRRAVARRPAHLRGARACRGRPGSASRIAAGTTRQGRPAPRGRHGRLGVGTARTVAPGPGRAAGPDRCSASSTVRHAGGRGQPAPPARNCAASLARPGCVGASRRTSSATRMPSRWPARACR